MKTDCEFFDECRRPVDSCTNKCPDYEMSGRKKMIGQLQKEMHDLNVKIYALNKELVVLNKAYNRAFRKCEKYRKEDIK